MTPIRPDLPRFPALTGPAFLISFLFGLVVLIITIVIWWRIFAKAGFSGVLGLLMFVPLANVIILLVLAFSKWPIEEEVERLRDLTRRNP